MLRGGILLLLITFCVAYFYFSYEKASGFSPEYIKIEGPEIALKNDVNVFPLLNQKFYYYQKGSQSFVFLGEDQSTILKFFRCNRYRSFFPCLLQKRNSKKREKWNRFMASCIIAHNELKEESALLYVKLKHTTHLPHIFIEDNLKRTFEIDLNETNFILQKKTDLLYPFLKECQKHQAHDIAQNLIAEIVNLIHVRQNKGIGDKDAALEKNIGLLNGKPYFIDIGEFYKIAPLDAFEQQKEIRKIAAKLEPWILKNYPEFYALFKEETYGCHPSLI